MSELFYDFLWINLLASLTALVLLAFKWLAREHMTARWHLGLWLILFWQLLGLPLAFEGQIRGRFTLWSALRLPLSRLNLLPMAQAAAGGAGADTPVLYVGGLYPANAPVLRVTGLEPLGSVRLEGLCTVLVWIWLGVAALLLVWFAATAVRQALRVSRMPDAPAELAGQVRSLIAESFAHERWLEDLRIVQGPAGTTPYVCRARTPVLVLPAGARPDDRVLMHELSHVAHGDVGKNMVILAFRCVYWCNPFLWWVLGRVSDDLEAACDERVLAMLTPARQVGYGRILLDMAVPRFRRQMGTSCIASGSRQIKERITRTARYCEITGFAKRAGLLAGLALFGLTFLMPEAEYSAVPGWKPAEDFNNVSAMVLKTHRASSPFEALWLYGMGEAADCGYYRYAAADEDTRAGLEAAFAQNATEGRANPWHYDSQILDLAAQEMLNHYVLSTAPENADRDAFAAETAATPGWYLGQKNVYPATSGFAVYDVFRENDGYTAAVSYTVQRDSWFEGMDFPRFYTDLVTVQKEQGRWVVRRTDRSYYENIWSYHDHLPENALLQQLHLTWQQEPVNNENAAVPLPRQAGYPLLTGGAFMDLATGRMTQPPQEPLLWNELNADTGWGRAIYGKEVPDNA